MQHFDHRDLSFLFPRINVIPCLATNTQDGKCYSSEVFRPATLCVYHSCGIRTYKGPKVMLAAEGTSRCLEDDDRFKTSVYGRQ
jgi:hypothetical protein